MSKPSPDDPIVKELAGLDAELPAALNERDASFRLLELLPTKYSSSAVATEHGARVWELVGLWFLNTGRIHEALALFSRLYQQMMAGQSVHRINKGLPLVWLSECYYGSKRAARVKTYRDVLEEYAWHSESKCADANGDPSGKRTIGLLRRRHIRVAALKYIGKESNKLEDVESGLIHAAESVSTQYPDPRHDEWLAVTEALREVSLNQFEQLTGKSRRMLIDARERRRVPHQRNRARLAAVARKLGVLE